MLWPSVLNVWVRTVPNGPCTKLMFDPFKTIDRCHGLPYALDLVVRDLILVLQGIGHLG